MSHEEFDPPVAHFLGRRVLERDRENGVVRGEFQTRPEMLNRHGTVQGGMLTAMMDGLCGRCLGMMVEGTGRQHVTLEIKTSFLEAAEPGRLLGTARILRLGKSIAFLEAEITNEAGKSKARAQATFRIVEGKR